MNGKVLFLGYMWKVAESIFEAKGWDLIAIGIEPQRANSIDAIKFCEASNIPQFDARKIRENSNFDEIIKNNIDLIVVGAFGQILPSVFFTYPKDGILNVHTSLLPNYPGGSPIETQIISGDQVGGVTLQWMEERVDAGDIISQEPVEISSTDYYRDVYQNYHQEAANLMTKLLCEAPELWPRHSHGSDGLVIPPSTESDAVIDWQMPAEQLAQRIRAFSWRGWCKATIDGGLVYIQRGRAVTQQASARKKPGTILAADADGFEIQTADGILLIEAFTRQTKISTE